MPKPTMTKAQLACIAEAFRDELVRLHEWMAFSDYKDTKLSLTVEHNNKKTKWEVVCQVDYSNTVRGSDLGIVMDEVYHRLNYEHREEARIAHSLPLQLPAATDTDVDADVLDDEEA